MPVLGRKEGLSQCKDLKELSSLLYYPLAEFSEFTQQFKNFRVICLTVLGFFSLSSCNSVTLYIAEQNAGIWETACKHITYKC